MKQLKRALWNLRSVDKSRPIGSYFIEAIGIIDQPIVGIGGFKDVETYMDELLERLRKQKRSRDAFGIREWLSVEENANSSVFTYVTPRGKARLTYTPATQHEKEKYLLEILDVAKITSEKLDKLVELLGPMLEIEVLASRTKDDVRDLLRQLG